MKSVHEHKWGIPIIIWICWVWGMIILFFSFYFHTCQGHVWKFYHLIIVSTFRLTNWNTLDQISAHNSHNKYGFQAIDQVQIFLLALLLEKFLRRLQYFFEIFLSFIRKLIQMFSFKVILLILSMIFRLVEKYDHNTRMCKFESLFSFWFSYHMGLYFKIHNFYPLKQ